ncbi:MAG TPA: hypothetical protein VIQ62_13005 [Burkholderiales bacterium]
MPRERARNDERSRIAHLAARLMAEDGIEDYALAKRKAARQAGVRDTRQLPTNDEVDEALRMHQALYRPAEHRERLRVLRERAARMMEELARFNPYLTGSVLSGSAGKYADINLQLYADNAKTVELYFIDNGIDYKPGQIRLFVGSEQRIAPVYTLEDETGEVQIIVLGADDLRAPVKTSAEGRPMERAKLDAVEALLADD